ncbi:putative ddhd domain-containing protein [Diplodia seriata]|uniref:Putative ddhd domain-containing protein n=1 Tax=Diplodia seriata TaxID=420778 RepID=A0A0G2EVT1_9PEZI|nr:putative ddhd domain-containing protein [Diplodia seriata]
MSSTMYQRFAGGGHFAGVKLIRGYVDLKAEKEKEKEKAKKKSAKDEKDDKDASTDAKAEASSKLEPKAVETSSGEQNPQDLEKQEEEVRKRAEREIREDYKEQEGEEQGREIEHLLLVTHGIGQRLGMRMESVNFVHDVNTLRKTLKSVYAGSADLQALNGEVDKLPKNCRVQVLPIVWRHLLDFPKQSLKHNRREFDLGDAHSIEDDEYPSLENITVEGVPAVRNLITDLALDVLLYQSPAYKSHISRIVLQECNRIYKLFKDRNPEFNGKVSLVGHSLGSAIMFDLLCQQKEERTRGERHKHHRRSEDLRLDFDVEDFYALGSPIGLFQMLHGKTIAARISQIETGEDGQHPPTLIDSELETLYSGFAKERGDADVRDLGEQREWQEIEERSRKLRREEAKVRALNSNGRVDYSIQEGAFDISLLASIASHLSYYADEDVSHFMISQLLARHRVLKKARSAPDFNKQ